jgi:hypothetical protein
MRRLLAALLLPAAFLASAACITETQDPLAPNVWYAVAPLPKVPRVGTVDRDQVVEVFRESRLFHEYCAAKTRERERSEQRGDQRGAAIQRVEERSLLTVRDGTAHPGRSVPTILKVLDRILPQIAVTNGVDIIVDEGSWTGEAKNVIDVTEAFVKALPTGEG